jgi:hypothetical protein
MYNDDWTRPPGDEAEMWATFADMLDAIAYDISLTVETPEDALADELHLQEDGSFNGNTLSVIRYRGISEENDQREHFLGMAKDLLPLVQRDIQERLLSPQFVQRWGQLLFCHGYAVSFILDDGDHVAAERARYNGARSVQLDAAATNAALAQLVVWFMDNRQQPRKRAERSAAQTITAFLQAKSSELSDEDRAWFEGMIRKGSITGRARQKRSSDAELREMAADEAMDTTYLHPFFPKG